MASGILVIDKPQDWTSMDVCARLRRCLQERRIGHAGTLDPMATGVLPVFVGRATRAVEFASEGEKEYLAGLRLGQVTDTQDITGTVLENHPVSVSLEDLQRALLPFQGRIQQIPPMYSAIKIQGKKLYELARKGKEVERPPRPITIHALTIERQVSGTDFLLRVRCSKGTYVRTLCHDIGQALGCGGTMFSLRRTMAAGFTLDQALPLDHVLHHLAPTSLLMPADTYFAGYPELVLPSQAEKKVRNGMSIFVPGLAEGEYRVYGAQREFLSLSRVQNEQLTTIKSFFEVPIPNRGSSGSKGES